MSFDVNMTDVYQSATNFFASAWPILRTIIGVFLGGLIIREIIGFFRKRTSE